VMEWYYNAQERIATTISDHASEVAFTWFYKDSALPVSIDDDNLQAAVVYVTVSYTYCLFGCQLDISCLGFCRYLQWTKGCRFD